MILQSLVLLSQHFRIGSRTFFLRISEFGERINQRIFGPNFSNRGGEEGSSIIQLNNETFGIAVQSEIPSLGNPGFIGLNESDGTAIRQRLEAGNSANAIVQANNGTIAILGTFSPEQAFISWWNQGQSECPIFGSCIRTVFGTNVESATLVDLDRAVIVGTGTLGANIFFFDFLKQEYEPGPTFSIDPSSDPIQVEIEEIRGRSIAQTINGDLAILTTIGPNW